MQMMHGNGSGGMMGDNQPMMQMVHSMDDMASNMHSSLEHMQELMNSGNMMNNPEMQKYMADMQDQMGSMMTTMEGMIKNMEEIHRLQQDRDNK